MNVRFVELTPPRRIVEAVMFLTDAPGLQGEMTQTASFDAVAEGTEVALLFENLSPGLRLEDNDFGMQLSLSQLARRFGRRRRRRISHAGLSAKDGPFRAASGGHGADLDGSLPPCYGHRLRTYPGHSRRSACSGDHG